MKTKIVYNTKIAAELCRQGFKVIRTQPNPQKPWLVCYVFEVSPGFYEALSKEVERRAARND